MDLLKLDYDKVIEKLKENAVSKNGITLCENLKPYTEKADVLRAQKETTESYNLFAKHGMIPIGFMEDTDLYIKTVESGISLSLKGLLTVADILKTARELTEYFKDENKEDYPILSNYFANLYQNREIEKTIFSNIYDDSNISDSASKRLSQIRKSISQNERDIKNRLNTFVHSSTYSKYLQEPVVTMRNDRFVIPVKQEYRSQIKGFVHDMSSSGSTLFIEPMSVFDMNNTINDLRVEEKLEIDRILKDYTNMFVPYTKELENNVRLIGILDFAFAKAKLADLMHAVEPIINDEKYVDLKNARHPLIDAEKVVPIDISVGKEYTSLVITGPNTGGKTVSLKTLGLITLMGMSGLHIPAKETSSIYVFDNIFADIGDEQSIQENLSTFSSHMTNISKIIKESTSESLILLDELGSGTDPLEGANLAISILEHFKNQGSLIVSTTHYPQIKQYALIEEGFKNASCEFDVEELRPTYKLLIGVPGKSNAFEISKRIGIDNNIIKRAQDLMDKDAISFEDVLKNIHDDKIKIENDKKEIEKNLIQITDLRKSLEKDNKDLENKSKEMVENAKREARDILLDAKDNATNIIREMKNNPDDIKALERLRSDLNKSIKNITFVDDENYKDGLPKVNVSDLEIGMRVYVSTFNQTGIIKDIPTKSGKVEVQMGGLNTYVKVDDLEILQNQEKENVSKVKTNVSSKSKTTSTELNIIGLTVDEAMPLVDKYMDDVFLSSMNTCRIVHGKGTGRLKQAVHTYLKNDKRVKSYRLGTYGEGDTGVTIVEIKR